MLALPLLAQAAPGPSTWLTPIWLVSVGVLVGLVVSAAVLGVTWLISRIGPIGGLYDRPTLRNRVGAVLSVLALVGSIPLIVVPQWNAAQATGGTGGAITDVALLAIALIPVSIAVGFGLLALVSRRTMDQIGDAIREGALYWFGSIFVGLAIFAVGGYALGLSNYASLQVVKQPNRKLESLWRLRDAKDGVEIKAEIPADNGSGTEVPIEFLSDELKTLVLFSNQRLEMAAQPIERDLPEHLIVPVAETIGTEEGVGYYHAPGYELSPIPPGRTTKLWFRNLGDGPASLTIRMTTQPEFPEVAVIPQTAIWVVGLVLLYLMQRTALPKISAIALSTFKTEAAQPVYLLFLILGSLFAVASIFIPYYTFNEDIKMLKDAVLTVMLVASIFMAVWAASKSIAEEIEGRTSLTVLSKPIGRRDFIIGKFVGIVWSTGLLYVALSVVFLIVVSYKPVYDLKETAGSEVLWQQCFAEMMSIVPAMVLAFMEVVVFVAIGVAISTRLPIMANLLICFSIYLLGHLTPLIVQSSVAVEAFEPVVFFGQLIATIVPVLDHFNVQAALTGGATVPMAYLGWAFIYCLLYAGIALLLGLILFEDRDLA